jgi:DnaJ-class molecular chaperone
MIGMAMEFKDYYATLGVPKTATDAEIKRAYRKLARKHHPDLNPNDKAAEARFKDINEANEVLGNPDTRKKYDELGANWRQYEQAAGAGGPAPGAAGWGVPFGGGGATYRTVTPEDMREMFGTDDPFSDFFHTFFAGATAGPSRGARARGRRQPPRPTRGSDVDHPVDLTLEEVLTGTTRRLVMKGETDRRTLDVRIPAGVRDGSRVRAQGGGAPAPPGGTAGDLYLIVRVLPHLRFERRDQDLLTHIAVPVTTAVLGGEAEVTSLGGNTLRLKIPPLSTPGRVLRLRGHGLPSVGRPDERGDLYVTLDAILPAELSDDERKHWEALKELNDRK